MARIGCGWPDSRPLKPLLIAALAPTDEAARLNGAGQQELIVELPGFGGGGIRRLGIDQLFQAGQIERFSRKRDVG